MLLTFDWYEQVLLHEVLLLQSLGVALLSGRLLKGHALVERPLHLDALVRPLGSHVADQGEALLV